MASLPQPTQQEPETQKEDSSKDVKGDKPFKDPETHKPEELSTSGEWEFVSRGSPENQIPEKENSGPFGALHEGIQDKGSSVLSNRANQQSPASFTTPTSPTSPTAEPKNGSLNDLQSAGSRGRAVSLAQSDTSRPGMGIYPPPGTPESPPHAGYEHADVAGLSLEGGDNSHTGNNHSSEGASVRKTAMLRAASNAEGLEKGTEAVSIDSTTNPDPTAENPLPRVPSRFFTSEEWRVLHAKFENTAMDENEPEQAESASQLPETIFERGVEDPQPAQPSENMPQEISRPKLTTGNIWRHDFGSALTDKDHDFGVSLTRERKRSSITEPEPWGDSSIESIQTTSSEHVPRSMRAGTVLSPRTGHLADVNPFVREHVQTLHAEEASGTGSSTGGDAEEPLARTNKLVEEHPQTLHSREASTTSESTAETSTEASGGVKVNPEDLFSATEQQTSSTPESLDKDTEGGVVLEATTASSSLTQDNLRFVPNTSFAAKTYSSTSIASGEIGKIDIPTKSSKTKQGCASETGTEH